MPRTQVIRLRRLSRVGAVTWVVSGILLAVPPIVLAESAATVRITGAESSPRLVLQSALRAAAEIRDEATRADVLRDIAAAQATAGDTAGALRTVERSQRGYPKSQALAGA